MTPAPCGYTKTKDKKQKGKQKMGLGSSIGDAKPRNQSNYLPTGNYDLMQVTQLKGIEKPGKLGFAANLDILESSGDEATRPGGDGDYYVDCLKFDGGMSGDVRQFLSVLTGSPLDQVRGDVIDAAVSTEQPFTGMLIKCKAWTHTTSNDRKITKYKFSPASKEDAVRAAGLRAELNMSELAVKSYTS